MPKNQTTTNKWECVTWLCPLPSCYSLLSPTNKLSTFELKSIIGSNLSILK